MKAALFLNPKGAVIITEEAKVSSFSLHTCDGHTNKGPGRYALWFTKEPVKILEHASLIVEGAPPECLTLNTREPIPENVYLRAPFAIESEVLSSEGYEPFASIGNWDNLFHMVYPADGISMEVLKSVH